MMILESSPPLRNGIEVCENESVIMILITFQMTHSMQKLFIEILRKQYEKEETFTFMFDCIIVNVLL